jgi:hypothetical protein
VSTSAKAAFKILVVDDDVAMRETLQGFAGGEFGRRMMQHYATDAAGIRPRLNNWHVTTKVITATRRSSFSWIDVHAS